MFGCLLAAGRWGWGRARAVEPQFDTAPRPGTTAAKRARFGAPASRLSSPYITGTTRLPTSSGGLSMAAHHERRQGGSAHTARQELRARATGWLRVGGGALAMIVMA